MCEIVLNKDYKTDDLIKYGFKKYGTNYRLNIPLYRYKDIPVVSASFIISVSDNYIGYDVIDNNSGEIYTHFYNRTYTNPKHNKVLKVVIKELNLNLEKMKRLNIISDYRKVK